VRGWGEERARDEKVCSYSVRREDRGRKSETVLQTRVTSLIPKVCVCINQFV